MSENSKFKDIDFVDFTLKVSTDDPSGVKYGQKEYWAELICPINKSIIDKFNPELFVDIGANYGFVSLLQHRLKENIRVVAVEPAPQLQFYLKSNLEPVLGANVKILNAVCTDLDGVSHEFSLAPHGSQDNRVLAESDAWEKVFVPSVTLQSILSSENVDGNIYIKIDTQGYEKKVFEGAERFLTHHKNWVMKTEFAPYWLRSQGTVPTDLLNYLVEHYNVYEWPSRPLVFDTFDKVTTKPLSAKEVQRFSSHVERREKVLKGGKLRHRGWCDLLITPKE